MYLAPRFGRSCHHIRADTCTRIQALALGVQDEAAARVGGGEVQAHHAAYAGWVLPAEHAAPLGRAALLLAHIVPGGVQTW